MKPETHPTHLNRRQFLNMLSWSSLAGAIVALMGGIWSYLRPNAYQAPPSLVAIGRLESYALDRPMLFAAQRLYIIRRPERLLALSAVCTHLGCLVRWDEASHTFICPCHGGHYDAEGVRLAGPPPRDLPLYPVFLSASGQLIADTSQFLDRDGDRNSDGDDHE